MRCVLIPQAGSDEGCELLPPGARPSNVFGASTISASIVFDGMGAEMFWQQGHLTQAPNPVASALITLQVCGDCVAVVRDSSEARRMVDAIHARGRRGPSAPASRACDTALACKGGAGPSHASIGGAASNGEACEPQQRLQWMLAGRAMSLSWESASRCSLPAPGELGEVLEQQEAAESDDEQRAEGSALCMASTSPWSVLSPELIGLILAAAGYSAALASTMSQVSRAWKAALLEDHGTWRKLRFLRVPLSCPRACHLPWLVVQAAQAGNLGACLAAARLCEDGNTAERAAKFWARAARLGHPEAQWRVGLSYYQGSFGQQLDSEEAVMWLSRAAKQLVDGGVKEPPLLLTASSTRVILSHAAHILGIMHLDGEGTRQDTALGLHWLKVASCCGCGEATRTLGSLFRNGQY